MKIKVKGREIVLTKAKDGWYEGKGLAVNPKKTRCITSPWLADHICPAPSHKFEIIEE